MQLSTKGRLSAALVAVAALSYSYIPTQIGKLKYYAMKEEKEKNLYLTFDDGPSSEYTAELLDLLKEYDIKAAFFTVGAFASENPDIIDRMKNEGHLIGLHSWDHSSAMTKTPFATDLDFERSVNGMRKLGVKAEYYRPPWGQVNITTKKSLEKYGLKKVLWHVMAEDWKENTTPEEIQYKLLKRTVSGDIICLHDGRGKGGAPAKMIQALRMTIPIWLEDGYVFRRVDEKVKDEE